MDAGFDIDLSEVEITPKICTVEIEGELEFSDVQWLLEKRPTATRAVGAAIG